MLLKDAEDGLLKLLSLNLVELELLEEDCGEMADRDCGDVGVDDDNVDEFATFVASATVDDEFDASVIVN